MKFSGRSSRAIALLVAALMAVGAIGITSTAGASNEAGIAKKCKKGYKKKTTKKKGKKTTKCVKKKKAKSSDLVQSVSITKGDASIRGTKLSVTVKLKRTTPSIKVTAKAKRGASETSKDTTVTIPEGALEHTFWVEAETYRLLTDRRLRHKPLSYWVVIDGVKSNTL